MDGLDFQTRGLSEVILDTLSGKAPQDGYLSGSAVLNPQDAFPLDKWALRTLDFPRKVRFKAVSARNREACRLFKRNQVLFPLISSRDNDHLRHRAAATNGTVSRSASQVRPPAFDEEHHLAASPSDEKRRSKGKQVAAPFEDRIIGFVEDDYGCWLVSDDTGRVLGLEDYWAEVVEREGYLSEPESLAQASADDAQRLTLGRKRYGGLVMDILIQAAEVLDHLHDKHLALGICTPESFQVKFRAPDPPDAPSVDLSDKAIHEWEPKIEIVDLSAAVGIDGFIAPESSSSGSQLVASDGDKRRSLASSSLAAPRPDATRSPSPRESQLVPLPYGNDLQSDGSGSSQASHPSSHGPSPDIALGTTPSTLNSEYFIRNHLRWIAPEALSRARVEHRDPRVGDLYSFGVLAYELITRSPVEPVHEEVDMLSDIHRHLNHSIVPAADRVAAKNSLYLLPPRLSEILSHCLNKDPSARYASMKALIHDLRTYQQLSTATGDMGLFSVGEADRASRFVLPRNLIAREKQLQSLNATYVAALGPRRPPPPPTGARPAHGRESSLPLPDAQSAAAIYSATATKGGLGTVTVWGTSGSGKSELMRVWARDLREKGGSAPLVGWAKLDQHMKKPLSGFVQIFTSLLDQIFSDPNADVSAWREKIMMALSSQASVFLNLVGPEWRDVLLLGNDAVVQDVEMDWEHFLNSTKYWLKRVLQTFASADRPLIIMIDDIQWLGDELPFWQALLAPSANRLENVLVVAGFRTETMAGDEDTPPPAELLLCNSVMVHVPRLNRPAIARYLQECFHLGDTDPKQAYLSNFLFSQTSGSPLFLASLVCQLVRDRTITFDWDQMRWTVNIDELPRHNAGIDKFLESVLRSFDSETQELLMMLSCIKSSGTKIEYLAGLVNIPTDQAKASLFPVSMAGVVQLLPDGTVRFRHDKQRVAAAALIPEERKAALHHHIGAWTVAHGSVDEYLFDTVDCFLMARKLGYPVQDERGLASLALRAAARANRAAAFRQSLEYLQCADDLAHLTEECSLPFAQLWTEVCAVERQTELGIRKIEQMLDSVTNPANGTGRQTLFIELRTLLVRLLINSGQLSEGVKMTVETIESLGYDQELRRQIAEESLPRTPEEVHSVKLEAERAWFESSEEQAIVVLVCRLLSYAGPAMFVSLKDNGQSYLELGVSLCTRLRSIPLAQRADYTAYLISVWSVTAVPSLALRQASVMLATEINQKGSFFENATVICCLAQLHLWTDLELLRPDFARAYETSVSSGNWDAGTYVLGFAFLTMLASKESIMEHEAQIVSWYSIVDQLPPPSQVFVKAPLQAFENFCDTSRPFDQLSNLDGRFISLKRDLAIVRDLPMYSLEFHLLQLHLKVWFLAPWSEVEPILRGGDASYRLFSGVIIAPLWIFLSAWYILTEGSEELQADADRKIQELEVFARTSDFKMQLRILQTVQAVRRARSRPETWASCLVRVEETLTAATGQGFVFLAGVVCFFWARELVAVHGRTSPLVAGYAAVAHRNLVHVRMLALARLVRSRFPDVNKAPPTPSLLLPSDALGLLSSADEASLSQPRTVRRADSSSTVSSQGGPELALASPPVDELGSKPDQLDSLTFIRASLVLAQSGNQISVELMRILLQFSRASYGALALASSASTNGTASLNLRACGTYENLCSHDIPLSSAAELCPASTILHVFRTNKAVLTVPSIEKRQDPFFKDWLPRSIIVLPLVLQGECRGVVLLLSRSFAAAAPAPAALEMVSSLASFAVITIESSENRLALERQVASRTEALQSALQSTTTFLSHMSHELRTPLHSVLGLLGVLEDSATLTPSERESLATIRNSGEDLQTVISNVLDISKIQAGGIVPESIPLDLRNLIEISLESVAATAVQKGIEVVYTVGVAEDIPCGLLSDSFRVKQILLNLLSNACKFCPKNSGAVVQVHSSAEAVDDRLKITISVKDTGPGIPASKMDRLFKTFSQVDSTTTRQHGGSGLGLAISKSLANLLGGDAWAESVHGEGATFSFSFMADKDIHSVPPTRPAHAVPKSAFIIFRGCAMRHVLEKHLVAYRVFPCRTASTYADAVAESNPEALSHNSYDFVFVDAAGISSDDFENIQHLQKQAKVILLTTSLDRGATLKRFNTDAEHVLVRPVRAHTLHDMVRPLQASTPAISTTLASQVSKVGKQFDNLLGKRCPLKILLVDDNRVNTVVGRKMLERFGYSDIDCCFDGQQAVNAAEGTRYDLIFMDLSMPVCDGYEANKKISHSPLVGHPPPLVVALTANTDKGTRDLVIDEGFFAFLSKPLNVSALGAVLTQTYSTINEASARRRSSVTSAASVEFEHRPVMPRIKSSSPPSMIYLDVFLAGC